jgi:hypothetical protein
MPKVIATQKIQTMCNGESDCSCPTISGDKACMLARLVNEFVSETNFVECSFETKEEYNAFVMYCALASLKGK